MIKDIQELNFPSYATMSAATVSLPYMGEWAITSQIKIDGEIAPDFSYDWEVVHDGHKYIQPLRKPAGSKDNEKFSSVISLTFQHWAIWQLKRFPFVTMQPIETGTAIADEEVAPISLNLGDFCNLFNQVLAYYYGDKITLQLNPEWQYKSEAENISISHTKVWNVLIEAFHKQFGVNWAIVPNGSSDKYVIKIGYPTTEQSHIFEYGFEGGLLKAERQTQSEEITNVLKGRGGEKNLPFRYFKALDPNNPDFTPDPDWIEELANIYFSRLMPATFRSYVQGWKAAHISKYPGYTPVGESNAYSPWAYRKGYTDTKFHPVEFVADEIVLPEAEASAHRQIEILPGFSPFVKKRSSLDKYGPLLNSLDDNDEIFPTIQGVVVNPYGRIDQTVEVEPITSDDIAESAESDAQITTFRQPWPEITEKVAKNSRKTIVLTGDWFSVPSGKTANFDEGGKSVVLTKDTLRIWYDFRTNTWYISKDEVAVGYDNVVIEETSVVLESATGGTVPASGIPSGTYRYKVTCKVHNTASEDYNVTVSLENPKLTDATLDDKWRDVWHIWVKNIWQTGKRTGETDKEYAERVWRPILGDREGNEAKVLFTSGALAVSEDYEFTIVATPEYDTSKTLDGVPSHWKITLAKNDADLESLGVYLPSTKRQAIAGDYFVFLGIDPQHYYTDWAERRLDDWKKDNLSDKSDIKPTWVVQTDRVRLNGEGKANALIRQLHPGDTLRLADKRFIEGAYETLYLTSLTITYREPTKEDAALNPDVEIVLSDRYEVSANPVSTLQGEVSALAKQVGSISNIEQIVRMVGDKLYLRKDGLPDRSLSPTEFASLLTSLGFRSGMVGGAGWGIYKDANGNWVIEADRFMARQDLEVNNLIINQVLGKGGTEVDCAAFIEITRVEETADGYKCYFDQHEGTVANLFHVDDVAWNNRYTPENADLKFYRRRITEVGADYVVLTKPLNGSARPSDWTDSGVNGIGIPAEGDVIVHRGNYTDKERQYIKVRDVVGGGYERYIEGLDSVNAEGVEYFFVGRQNDQDPRLLIGRKDGEYAEWKDGKLNIKGSLSVQSTIDGKSVDDYIREIAPEFDDDELRVLIGYAQGAADNAQDSADKAQADASDAAQAASDAQDAADAAGSLASDAYSKATAAEALADSYRYLKENLLNAVTDNTQIVGGLMLSTMIALGYTEGEARHILSGMNGSYNPELGGRTPAAWYGGNMIDRFDPLGLPYQTPPANAATSMIRMDGSAYFANGNAGWENDGSGWFGDRASGRAITFKDGAMTFGSGIVIDLGGGNTDTFQGLSDTISSLVTSLENINQSFIPIYLDGTTPKETTWGEINKGNKTLWAVKSAKGLYSDEFISARGLNPFANGGAVGASALADLTDVTLGNDLAAGQSLVFNGSKWVNQAVAVDLTPYALKTELVSSAERTLWNQTAADLAAIMGADTNGALDKWNEITAFLDTYTEADTLANLLGNKVSKTGDTMTGTLHIAEGGYLDIRGSFITGLDDGGFLFMPSGTLRAEMSKIAFYPITSMLLGMSAHRWQTVYATNVDASNKIKIGDCEITWDADKGGLHFSKGIYSDEWISARGANAGASGGVVGIDEATLADYLTDNGYATQTWVEGKGYATTSSLAYYLRVDGSNGTQGGVSALLHKLTEATGDLTDATMLVTSNNADPVADTYYYRRSATHLWNYVKGKADGVYQPKGSYVTSLSGYATQSWVENKGYLTGITKAQVEAVLTGNITSHTHSQYLTSHQSLDNCLYAFGASDFDPATYDGYYAGMTLKSGITTDWWHILSMSWGTTNTAGNKSWASQLALPTQTRRGLRYRTGANATAYSDWVTVIDSTNISSYAITSHQSLANYVDKTSAQEISGVKTFTAQSNAFRDNVRGLLIYSNIRDKAGAIEIAGANGVWTANCMEFENNGDVTFRKKIIKTGGTSSQFLKADGSVDGNSYALASSLGNYLPLTGGTLTGRVRITTNNREVSFGCDNTVYAHYKTNADNGHWFDKNVSVQGNIYAGSGYNQLVWHAGNDGSGSGLDADLLDGVHNGNVTALNLNVIGSVSDFNATLNRNGIYKWGANIPNQPNNYGAMLQWSNVNNPVGGTSEHWITQLASSTNNRLYYRTRTNGANWNNWSPLAFTTDNVASATKLLNTRTIWGQNFNGEGNVSGNMTGVGSITASGSITATTSTSGDMLFRAANANGSIELLTSTNRGVYDRTITQWLIATNGTNSWLTLGNVGLGTTTPSYKLEVNGTAYATKGQFNTTTSTYALNAASFICDSWIRTTGATGWYSETYGGGWYMNETTWVRTYNNKSIYSGTGVIRSDNYFDRQDYAGTSWNQGYGAYNVAITNNTSQTPLMVAYRSGQTPAATGSNRVFAMELYNAGTQFRFCFGGSDKYYFHSDGVLHTTGGVWSDGYISARGQNTSDVRLKEQIRDFNATDIIKALHPVAFKWNAMAKSRFEIFRTDDVQYGLIAQETELVAPWLVDRDMFGDGLWGVKYEKLIPVLLQAQKEVTFTVDDLVVKVKRLESENKELKRKIEILERR